MSLMGYLVPGRVRDRGIYLRVQDYDPVLRAHCGLPQKWEFPVPVVERDGDVEPGLEPDEMEHA